MPLGVRDQLSDAHGCPGIPRFHLLSTSGDPVYLTPEELCHGGLTPFVLPLGVVSILQSRHRGEMLPAPVIIYDLAP
jgi:hypothetical protein